MSGKIFYFFFILTFFSCKKTNSNKELLNQLDSTIKNRKVYSEKKESKIDSLKKVANKTRSLDDKYSIYKKIYNEYKFYNGDSTFSYIYKNKSIAYNLNNQKYIDETQIQLSIVFAISGLIKEASESLEEVKRPSLSSSLLLDYYTAHKWINQVSYSIINDKIFSPKYKLIEINYRDSLQGELPKNSIEFKLNQADLLFLKKEYNQSKSKLLELLPEMQENSRQFAMTNNILSSIYKMEDNTNLYEKHLILSCIADQKDAVKEYVSLKELAFYLYENKPDELDRANEYIQISLEDARFYNNRQRIIQIAEKLPLILTSFQNKSLEEYKILKYLLITVSILFVFLILMVIYINKQILLLKTARRKLYILNNELEQTNHKLVLAKETREEHIGLFMDLCSSYINKLQQYKETVRRKILSNQIDDLFKMKDSSQLVKYELKEFFNNFDKAVLNLFPNFIDNFNKLLHEKDQITLKKGELLNTELRIFALIRLGISDSSKIAIFLHYSPQTIYNYRTKIKNGAKTNREKFEEDVMNIN